MPTAWEDQPGDAQRIAANAATVLGRIAADAEDRAVPTVRMAMRWHRNLYEGIARPFDYYAGEPRDSDHRFPDLIGYEVQVGDALGVPSAMVPQALRQFEAGAQVGAVTLDAEIPVGADLTTLPSEKLHGALTYGAVLHGEWVRIHPFANGNGRTARLWANWAALRYGLPPFVTIRPRPRSPYGMAALASMRGDHQVMVAVMDQMLREFLAGLQ